MGLSPTCTCSTCPKCKNREYNKKFRAKTLENIKKLPRESLPPSFTHKHGKGELVLFDYPPAKLGGRSTTEDTSREGYYYYGPSFPGSTLDPNRMFFLREVRD
jgi:hypothetical protein